MTYAPVARIVLRYAVGAAVMYGLIGAETGEYLVVDPDLTLIVGTVIGAVVEAVYAYAKKKGWAT